MSKCRFWGEFLDFRCFEVVLVIFKHLKSFQIVKFAVDSENRTYFNVSIDLHIEIIYF